MSILYYQLSTYRRYELPSNHQRPAETSQGIPENSQETAAGDGGIKKETAEREISHA